VEYFIPWAKGLLHRARAYGVHPVTLANWKRHFLERGAEVFGGKEEVHPVE
jgi:transposase-like protein